MGGTALSEGIGEVLTKLAPMPKCVLLVAKPDINVSTKEVYQALDSQSVPWHPDVDGMRQAIEEGRLEGIYSRLGNVLETVTIAKHPIVSEIKQEMLGNGALGSLMSGSGPSVFGIFDDEEKARAAGESIEKKGLAKQVFVTEPQSYFG